MNNKEIATLAGGCFWCLETMYSSLIGVEKVLSGYAGGQKETANYKAVCSGTTKHAEAVQIHFDPSIISFTELLEIFWTMHDPTTLNRQGNDVGPQYRSAIFHHNAKQKEQALKSLDEVGKTIWTDPIVTEITAFTNFFEAESYHQDYYNRVGDQNAYCTAIISPKVQKFRKKYAHRMK